MPKHSTQSTLTSMALLSLLTKVMEYNQREGDQRQDYLDKMAKVLLNEIHK